MHLSHYLLPPRARIIKKLELAAEPGLEQVLCCGHAKKPFNYCAKSSSSFQFVMEIFIFVCHCKEKSLFFMPHFILIFVLHIDSPWLLKKWHRHRLTSMWSQDWVGREECGQLALSPPWFSNKLLQPR